MESVNFYPLKPLKHIKMVDGGRFLDLDLHRDIIIYVNVMEIKFKENKALRNITPEYVNEHVPNEINKHLDKIVQNRNVPDSLAVQQCLSKDSGKMFKL